MKTMLTFTIAGALTLFSSGAVARGAVSDDQAAEMRISRILYGRTAGAPTDCINLSDIASSQVVSGTAIIYRMRNGTMYLNRPESGASFLSRDDILVTDTHSSRLCRIDIVRLVDSGSHMPNGTVGLGHFIPYSRSARNVMH